jgi:hypothetical protein
MNGKAFAPPASDPFFDLSELYNSIVQPSRTSNKVDTPRLFAPDVTPPALLLPILALIADWYCSRHSPCHAGGTRIPLWLTFYSGSLQSPRLSFRSSRK